MDAPARKTMPTAVARLLRQEAGFGCCKCGSPIVPWSEDQHFRPEDMMVLCPLHHDQVTKGAMSLAEQRESKSKPYNIERGYVFGLLEVKQDYCAADLGTITVVGEGPFIRINGTDVLSLYMGPKNLEVSLKLYSETNELLVEIDRNEWVSGDPMPWDIEANWQTLVLREKARKISISLDARQIPLQLRGEFWHSRRKITVETDKILVHGRVSFGFAHLALVGGGIEVDTEQVRVAGDSNGLIISWHNPRERLWKARDAWEIMKRQRISKS